MCYRPLHIKDSLGVVRNVPCGRCTECKRSRTNAFRLRALGEAYSTQDKNGYCFFVTLTYNDAHLPYLSITEDNVSREIPCFNRKHITDFFKRLRNDITNRYSNTACVRYIQCSEYGSKFGRPHYHCLFFVTGISYQEFNFKQLVTDNWSINIGTNRKPLYESLGFVDVQLCKDIVKSANYVSKYISKQFSFTDESDNVYTSGDKLEKFFNLDLAAPDTTISDLHSIDLGTGELFSPSCVTIRRLSDVRSLRGYKLFKSAEDNSISPSIVSNSSSLTTYNFHRSSIGLGEDWIVTHTDDSVLRSGHISISGTDKTGKQRVFNYSLGPYLYRKLTHTKVTNKDIYPLIQPNNKYYTRYSQVYFINEKGFDVTLSKVCKIVDKMLEKIRTWCGQNFNSPIYGNLCSHFDINLVRANLLCMLAPSVYLIPQDMYIPEELIPFTFTHPNYPSFTLCSVNRLSTTLLIQNELFDFVTHSWFNSYNHIDSNSLCIIETFLRLPENIILNAHIEFAQRKQQDIDKLKLRNSSTNYWYE